MRAEAHYISVSVFDSYIDDDSLILPAGLLEWEDAYDTIQIEVGSTADTNEYTIEGLRSYSDVRKRAGAPPVVGTTTVYTSGAVATTITTRLSITSSQDVVQDVEYIIVTTAPAVIVSAATTTTDDFGQFAPVPSTTATATGSHNTISLDFPSQQIVPGLNCKNCSIEGSVDLADGSFTLTTFEDAYFTAVANGLTAHVELEAFISPKEKISQFIYPLKTVSLSAYGIPHIAAIQPVLVAELFGQISAGANIDMAWGFDISVSLPFYRRSKSLWCLDSRWVGNEFAPQRHYSILDYRFVSSIIPRLLETLTPQ